MLADHTRRGLTHAQRHDVLQDVWLEVVAEIQRVADALDRLPEKELFRHVVQVVRHFLEALVAFAQAGRDGVHVRRHGVDVTDQIGLGAILEEAAPLWLQLDERQIGRQIAARLGEDATQHARHGQDGRAHVEAEVATPELGRGGRGQVQHRRLAAEPGILLQDSDPVATGASNRGCSKPAQPGADDDDV